MNLMRAKRSRVPAKPSPKRCRLRGSYDAAQTTANNRRRWQPSNSLSANDTNSPAVRQTLRNRSRYEVANNSYARGIVLTLANDTIGTGPRLQMMTPDAVLNRQLESSFMAWSKAVRLPEKLRTMRMARAQDGEVFAIMGTNPKLDHAVKLDLRLVEAEQVSAPTTTVENSSDGITFDRYGNPVSYSLLKDGELFGQYRTISASNMIHYFRPERPNQYRGIPEITPALELFGMLRSFTLSVLDAASTAANHAGIAYTDAPAGTEPDDVDAFTEMQSERNMFKFLPYGWKMAQLKPEQPVTSYGEFKHEILNEIARCLNMPFNIAAGNSSGYNYASGRLDHQTYHKSVRVEQFNIAATILDRLLANWLWEYSLTEGFVLADKAGTWFWDGTEHVDPVKEAKAQEIRLKNHTTTLAIEYAKQGLDWENQLDQRTKEINRIGQLATGEKEQQ